MVTVEDLQKRLHAEQTLELFIRVRPHAAKTRLTSILQDGSVKIDVAVPAEDNRGNVAVVRFLADQFAVPTSNVKILSGKTSRMKLVRVIAQ